jgi:hypothetical protein
MHYSPESLNQSKPRASCSHEIDLIDLHSLRSNSKYLTADRREIENIWSETGTSMSVGSFKI